MILHSEVTQEGILQAYLPDLRGKRVILSIVPDTQDTTPNWTNIATALRRVDELTPGRERRTSDILADLRAFRETQ